MPKVLIADDDDALRLLIRETLSLHEAAEYHFLEAADGPTALDLALREKPDIILMDILMPDMDGREVCRLLKSREDTRSIPIVLITALKGDEDRLTGIEAGGDDFLIKPFSVLELMLRVRSLLRIKQLHDELQNRYEELRSANEELHRLSQLKDDLTNMIIHDMRTPLSSIQLALQFVLENTAELPDLQRQTLQIAYSSALQLTKMVSDLLDISRMEQGKLLLNRQPVDLREVVEVKFQELEPLASIDRKKLVSDLPSDLPLVKADQGLVARILDNLLANALRYAPPDSEVSVRAGASSSGDFLQISVHDDGPGIPKQFQEIIFDRFRQADSQRKSAGQGVGLGLAFCKMAVQAHGGAIWVESEEGRGSTFHFTLPLADDRGQSELT